MAGMESNDSQAILAERMLALDRELLRQYLRGLRSDNPRVRKKSARGLGRLGGLASEAVPTLEACLTDRDFRVRDAAAWALDAIRERS
jgi:HEAT repeat protein